MPRHFTFFGRSTSLLLLIFYKLLLAAIEMLAGILFLFAAFFIKHISVAATISSIPNKDDLARFTDWLIQHLLALNIDYELVLHIGLVLVALGFFKVFVAVGLWFKSHKMRTIALVIFGGLSLYSAYELYLDFSVFRSISLVLDLVIVYYFWRILPRHLAD